MSQVRVMKQIRGTVTKLYQPQLAQVQPKVVKQVVKLLEAFPPSSFSQFGTQSFISSWQVTETTSLCFQLKFFTFNLSKSFCRPCLNFQVQNPFQICVSIMSHVQVSCSYGVSLRIIRSSPRTLRKGAKLRRLWIRLSGLFVSKIQIRYLPLFMYATVHFPFYYVS